MTLAISESFYCFCCCRAECRIGFESVALSNAVPNALTIESECRCTFDCLHTHTHTLHTTHPHRHRSHGVTVTQFKHFARFINRFLYQNGKTFPELEKLSTKRANASGFVLAIPFVRSFVCLKANKAKTFSGFRMPAFVEIRKLSLCLAER